MGYSHSVVERILPSGIDAWCPLLVIGNRKSGGANTDLVLNSFRTYLNSVQVRDEFDRISISIGNSSLGYRHFNHCTNIYS